MVLAFLGMLLASAQFTTANTMVTIRDYNDNIHETIVDPGATVTLYVEITTDISLVSGQFFIYEPTHSGYVTVNSLTWNEGPWDASEELTGYLPSMQPFDADTNDNPYGYAYASADIGTVAVDLVNGTGTGTYLFFTMSVTISDQVQYGAGYVLNLTEMFFGTIGWGDALAYSGGPYSITIVSALGAAFLGFIGLSIAGWLKRRRKNRD